MYMIFILIQGFLIFHKESYLVWDSYPRSWTYRAHALTTELSG